MALPSYANDLKRKYRRRRFYAKKEEQIIPYSRKLFSNATYCGKNYYLPMKSN